MDATVSVFLTVFLVFAGVVLVVAWILMPFAVFGLKRLMRELIDQQRQTNAHLDWMNRHRREREPVGPGRRPEP